MVETPVVLDWAGDIDLATVDLCRAGVDVVLASNVVTSLVIELGSVGFVDSVGIGAFIHARNACSDAGVSLTLRAMPPGVRRLFVIAGIADAFVFDDPHPTRLMSVDALPVSTELPPISDPQLDRVAALVSRLLRVPVALVTLVDRNRQVFPGAVGLPEPWQAERTTPLSHSFCQYVVGRGAPLVVPDSQADPLLGANAAVNELNVAAYAGIPITDLNGRTVGSLCAIDSQPREWTDDELADLRDIAALCSAEIQKRTALRLSRANGLHNRSMRSVQDQVDHALRDVVAELDDVVQRVEQPSADRLRSTRTRVTAARVALEACQAAPADLSAQQ